jgi:hypothetical protein
MEPFILPVNVLVEGPTDEAVVRRILAHSGLPCGIVHGKQGKSYLLDRLPNYNQAAHFAPWLVVVDLDQDSNCAPPFVEERLPHPARGMCFRVAVRAVEAWLMADAERIAAFLDVPVNRIPHHPEAELDPKNTLVNLARRSRSVAIREDMVPRQASGNRVGGGYPGRLIEFVTTANNPWRPGVAAKRFDSLRRCLETVETLKTWTQE